MELSQKLYSTKKGTRWGVNVGKLGNKGIVSVLNNTKNQQAKVSTVALTLEKLIDGNLSVCPVLNQTDTYVEYKSTSGDVKSYIVSLDAISKTFRVISDVDYEFGIVSAVFGATIYNEKAIEELKDNGFEVQVLLQYVDDLSNVDEYQMFCACDAFYYAIGKEFKVDYEHDATLFEAQKTRLVQGNLLTHDNPSAEPSLVGLGGKGGSSAPKVVREDFFEESLEDFKKRCRDGFFALDIEWDDRQKKMIEPLVYFDRYVAVEEFREELISVWKQLVAIKAKVDAGLPYDVVMEEPVNPLIIGKPGTGKTEMLKAIACALQLPTNMTNLKETSEEDELEGLNKIVNGKIFPIPTPLAMIFSTGGLAVLEEINLPNPGILQGAIGQALVAPYELRVDGYRPYKRSPFTVIAATMNSGTDGTKPLNQALASRFDDGLILEDVEQDEFAKIVYKTGHPKECCDMAVRTYRAALDYLNESNNAEYCLSITLRACRKMAQKLAFGFSKEKAIRSAFISQIYTRDAEVALDLEEHLKRVV